MNVKVLAARFALVVSCVLMTSAPAQARYLQCAPFAREVSGIEIRGNANTWWGQAQGRYERGATPQVGAVMAFKATRAMPVGHVAMVSRIVGDREVLLTHANWSHRGGIERDVRAVDVSAAGDWSEVRVWFAGIGGLGTSSYPLSGFIYAGKAPTVEPATTLAPLTIATSAVVPVDAAVPAAY
ncbi:CHAP domain-containing protein [Sphingomonas sp. BE138]|uniref:CHAP domain-containing protein n=1 Tax=Sphingomonas sp. BE138 TaxID=2817845 RepID=UPI00286A3A33|nr:CHAP domain-containing protein [Sphingomonas sp. BE138]